MADIHNFTFPREPASVPKARAALERFDGRLSASALYDASLCLSELVTNAVQHPTGTGEDLELHLQLTDERLRVQVVDPGAGFEPDTPTEGDERGWGLFIVDQLATRWGAEPGERTVIWFEIAIDEARAESAGSARVGTATTAPGDARRGEVANAVARLRLRPAIR